VGLLSNTFQVNIEDDVHAYKLLLEHLLHPHDAFELGEMNVNREIRVKRGHWRQKMAVLTRCDIQHNHIHFKSNPMKDGRE
jgi:hypothetical protein